MAILDVIIGISIFAIMVYIFFTKRNVLINLIKTLVLGFILALLLVAFGSYLVLSPLNINLSPTEYSYLFIIIFILIVGYHLWQDSSRTQNIPYSS